MRTLGQEAELAAHAIDPHPPREPRAMCPPTPPPESGEDVVCDVTLTGDGDKDDDDDDVMDDHSAAMGIVYDHSLYMTPDGEGNRTPQYPRLAPRSALSREIEKDKAFKQDGLEIDTVLADDVRMSDLSTDGATSMPTPQSVAMDDDTTPSFHTTKTPETVTAHAESSSLQGDDLRHGGVVETSNGQEPNETMESSSKSSSTIFTAATNLTSLASSTPLLTAPRHSFTSKRLYPHYPSSFLRPGSKFSGTQQSDHQIYNVDVQILTLSVPESTLTGYLRICGLTEDHPTLTTFFTGEIIGGPTHKHTFQTRDPSWGANDRSDLHHWARFPAWKHLSKDAKRDINFNYPPPKSSIGLRPTHSSPTPDPDERAYELGQDANPGWWTQSNIFMRWKEWFLVPDHRVRSIQGASFEGFYYICFNQVEGKINGIYFHARSEK